MYSDITYCLHKGTEITQLECSTFICSAVNWDSLRDCRECDNGQSLMEQCPYRNSDIENNKEQVKRLESLFKNFRNLML